MRSNEQPEDVRRVLAIDGGGIKGVIPASFLAKIEDVTGKRVVDHFDLIVGTSTGGIIALGLGLGLPADEIRGFYEEFGSSIFPRKRNPWLVPGVWRLVRRLARPKYSTKGFRSALESVFQERTLGESATRLVIPAFAPNSRSVYVFKTAHHERLGTDWKSGAVEVAMATGAAPTYFREHYLRGGTMLVDGGVWANNPVGLAVVEAIGVLGWRSNTLRVLSLGCSEEVSPFPKNPGLWAMKSGSSGVMVGPL